MLITIIAMWVTVAVLT